MLATIITTDYELNQVIQLSLENAKHAVSPEEKASDGFVSWSYTPALLKQLHQVHPSVIVKDNQTLAGYALVAFKEAATFHKDLAATISHLDKLSYKNKSLSTCRYYIIGQVCVAKPYRGKGVIEMLYKKHKELFAKDFDFAVTDISTSNYRSLRAHEKIGFKSIHTYTDSMDEWNVVLWDWQ